MRKVIHSGVRHRIGLRYEGTPEMQYKLGFL